MFNEMFLAVILLIAGTSQICGDDTVRSDIKGRLLTPEEGCGISKAPNNNRIVGGAPARNGAWPWIALLGEKILINRKKITFRVLFSCGGSLITSRHVLSAAHCFSSEFDVVRLGEFDTESTRDGEHLDIGIAGFETHENYSKHLVFHTNDIALVYLKHDIEFTDRISPICMPISEDMQSRSFVGSTPFVAGWGNLYENVYDTINILQQVQVPIIENAECKEKYQTIFRYDKLADFRFSKSHILCAGLSSGGKDACQGDSGGPMMLPIHENGRFPFYQIGIVSCGLGCGRPNVPGIYTSVQNYMDWILEKLH